MALDTEKIIEDLKGASILELNDLVRTLRKAFLKTKLMTLNLNLKKLALQLH